MMAVRLFFKELNTGLAKTNGHFDLLLLEDQIRGCWQKVPHNLNLINWALIIFA
jgi:hypothetical protein